MDTPSPAISVLMPVYNAGRFLAPALESVIGQTFADFELIALDGGSTDGSVELLRAIAARDPRVRVVSEKALGLVESLNLGLALARAPLIARMDADDLARPDRLDKQRRFLRDHPDIVAVSGAMDVIDEDGKYLETIVFPTLPASIAGELLRRSVVSHPAAMVRTETLRVVSGYRRTARHAEDYDLWLRLVEIGPIANLPDVVLSYRSHATNTSIVRFIEQQIAVLAARAAARQRRSGKPDPLALMEQSASVVPMTYRDLCSLLEDGNLAADVAFPFFRETLSRASEIGAIGRWLGLYLRYGLWEIDGAGAKVIMLVAANLLLRRRRDGVAAGHLLPYVVALLATACRHPIVTSRELVRLPQWRRIARSGLLRSATRPDGD
jgi:glycosyltransferase involved in cell wall biosynthesis